MLTMRFSRDLAREILLNIEENWGANGPSQSQLENLGMLAPGTPMDSIHYHLRKLNEAGFIVLVLTSIRSKSDEPDMLHRYPASLTYAGHQFLDDIRDPGRWQKIKKITGPVGFTTMKALMPEIVKKVIEL